MRKHEMNKLQMIETVVSYMNGNQSVTANIPVIAEKVCELISIQNKIHGFEETRFSKAKASTIAKNEARRRAEQAGSSYAAKLFDLGIKKNDAELMVRYDVTISDFIRLRDVSLASYLLTIKSDLSANMQELESYGVTPGSFEEFSAVVDNCNALTGERDVSKAVKSSAIKSITSLFEEATEILSVLDRLVLEFLAKNPGFYNGYKSARVIRDVGYRSKAVTGENQNVPAQ